MAQTAQSLAPSANVTSDAPSARAHLDQALAVLAEHAREFAALPVTTKAALVRECIPRLREVAAEWVARGCQAKGLSPSEAGEEWLAGPLPTVRNLYLLSKSLDAIAAEGRPPLGRRSTLRSDGRVLVEAFPTNAREGLLYGGIKGHVLLQDGIDEQRARELQAEFYAQTAPEGGVSLILGAGNVSSIPPTDVFTKMFGEGFVCLLKMNPVNEWVGPYLERMMAPLVSRGYLRIVYGGAEEGKYLVEHELVDDLHMTGSDHTHDLIVWGPPGEERNRRKRDNDPLSTKPISSELGNVSPVAIVPYTYSASELEFQARNVVAMVVNNASFNCNAAKLLITAKGWAQRDQFLALVEKGLSAQPPRRAYYPGAFERYRLLTEGREGLQTFGTASDSCLAWAFLRDVDSSNEDDPIFRVEPFCGILSQTEIASADPVDFLDKLTTFLNDRVWGTLNCCLVVHPRLEKDAAVSRALDRAILELRYGTVAINVWPAVCYGAMSMPWGGHPSATLDNIQSGLGWVHNTYMLGGIDKSIVRAPLKMWPDPLWFTDNPSTTRMGPAIIDMEAAPSWWKVPSLMAKALF